MTSPRDGCFPFTKVFVATRPPQCLLVSKAMPAVRCAVDGPGGTSSQLPFLPVPPAGPFNAFRVQPVVAVTLKWGVRLMKLLDNDDKDCVDFSTMLKFVELFGWGIHLK